MAYQSLYRRYRPQTFGAIRGQPHLVAALQNAVVRGEVGHAYLLHGPRGTGKTSSARVLAKALNCEALSPEGEPCGVCDSCTAIEQVWVLATTEPHKVVDTIRSRCQSFELSLLGASELAEHVRWVIADAGLEVAPDVVDHVVAAGGGSVRDTLSALDRVVAAGGMADLDTSTDALLEAIASHDVAGALSAVGEASARGRDPRTIGEGVLAGLRDAFLVAMDAPPPRMTPPAHERACRIAQAMPPARITSALDALGRSLVDMRQAPDPRVDIEVTLVRLCRGEAEHSAEALAGEVQKLKRRVQQLESSAGPGRQPDRPAPPAGRPPPVPPSPPPVPLRAVPAGIPSAGPSEAQAPAADASAAASAPGPAAARRALADKVKDSAAAIGPSVGDPASERPTTKTAVVQLAHRYFDIPLERVAGKSQEMFGPGKHELSEQQLCELWQAIVEEQAAAHPATPTPDPHVGTTPADQDAQTVHESESAREPVVERAAEAAAAPGGEREGPSSSEPGTDRGPGHGPARSTADMAERNGPEPQHGARPQGRPQAKTPDPDPAEPEPVPEDDDIDLDSLDDAPGRIELLVSQVQERFPGAKHHAKLEQQ